jgi:hypothetical protein
MALDLDWETRLALVDEINRLIPSGEQKNLASAISTARKTELSTESAELSRLRHKKREAVERMLGPERAEVVLGTICGELKVNMAELVRTARRAARAALRAAPDRHPAWPELGAAAIWVDPVPGLQDGMETLRREASPSSFRPVVWLIGPAGSGKSARLRRAQQQGIGRLLDEVPDEAGPGAVWLVDEPRERDAWVAAAKRCKACVVIATRAAPPDARPKLELGPWTRHEVDAYLDALHAARAPGGQGRGGGGEALEAADLERIADTLAALDGAWTPLDLGDVIRLLVDEPELLAPDVDGRELRIRSALHQLHRRADLPAGLEERWRTHGRRALAAAAAAAIRGAAGGRVIAPIGEAALREALASVAGTAVGGPHGEPLRAILERAKGEDGKRPMKLLEAWAEHPSSDDLIELLVESGAWRRADQGLLAPADEQLALALAAEILDDAWMWSRLLETLGDPGWLAARMAWAARLGRVEERIAELLATEAAVHVGAIELAVALVAFAGESPRAEQIERAVLSAVWMLEREELTRIGIGRAPQRALLGEAVRAASRRHRRTLPPVTTSLTTHDVLARATESTRRLSRAVERLAAGRDWPERESSLAVPAWISYALLLPWQALPVLEELDASPRHPFMPVDCDWEAVILDHAADGHPWARAVATGDLDEDSGALALVWGRGRLRALARWHGPSELRRHRRAVQMVLSGLSSRHTAPGSRFHAEVVQVIADFVQRHPEHPLDDSLWRGHEALLREALDRAGAIERLQAWFEDELHAFVSLTGPDGPLAQIFAAALRDRLLRDFNGRLDGRLDELLRLGEMLHRRGDRAPLRRLLEQADRPSYTGGHDAWWRLGMGAARALLRLRDDEALRPLIGRHGGALADTVRKVLAGDHDEGTQDWIAGVLGEWSLAFLESIAERPERREVAKRWALDPSQPPRRSAAAVWLLAHPAEGELAHVGWLFTSEPVAHGALHASAGLGHPDAAIRRVAAALLPRALRELGAEPELLGVARCFDGTRESGDSLLESSADTRSLLELKQYIDQVNASDQACSAGIIQTLIGAAQRYLAIAPDDDAWAAASLCASLATAARRARLASLAAWVREPLGAASGALDAARIDRVRREIARGLLDGGPAAKLDGGVLQALAEHEASGYYRANAALLESASPTTAELMDEWAAVSDEVLVGEAVPTPRWVAVQELLVRRDPHGLARRLADRLLELPSALRLLGIPQISFVAMLDARQVARLSPLFE